MNSFSWNTSWTLNAHDAQHYVNGKIILQEEIEYAENIQWNSTAYLPTISTGFSEVLLPKKTSTNVLNAKWTVFEENVSFIIHLCLWKYSLNLGSFEYTTYTHGTSTHTHTHTHARTHTHTHTQTYPVTRISIGYKLFSVIHVTLVYIRHFAWYLVSNIS